MLRGQKREAPGKLGGPGALSTRGKLSTVTWGLPSLLGCVPAHIYVCVHPVKGRFNAVLVLLRLSLLTLSTLGRTQQMNVSLHSSLEDAAHRSDGHLQGLSSGFSLRCQAIFTHCPDRHTAYACPKRSSCCLRYPSCRPQNMLSANALHDRGPERHVA